MVQGKKRKHLAPRALPYVKKRITITHLKTKRTMNSDKQQTGKNRIPWQSPQITSLAVEQTNQLPPPEIS